MLFIATSYCKVIVKSDCYYTFRHNGNTVIDSHSTENRVEKHEPTKFLLL